MNADSGCVCDGVAVPGGYSTSAAISDLPVTFGSSRSKTRVVVSWCSAGPCARAGIEVTARTAAPAARMACFMMVAPFPGWLLLGRSWRRAETDSHPVVGVHQTNRDREVSELFLIEHGSGGFILGIGHARFGNAGHRLR